MTPSQDKALDLAVEAFNAGEANCQLWPECSKAGTCPSCERLWLAAACARYHAALSGEPLKADQVREIARAAIQDWVMGHYGALTWADVQRCTAEAHPGSHITVDMEVAEHVSRVVSRFTATKETGK